MLLRIANGDPLELGPRVDAHLAEEGLMLTPRRVQLRALAAVAYAACAQGAPLDLGPWLRMRIRESATALIDEDREAERRNAPLAPDSAHFLPMIAAFGVEPGLARRTSVAFHSLPVPRRLLLRGIVQEGRSLAEMTQELRRPVEETRAELRAAVESLERAIGARLSERLGGEDRG
ncbi:MAG: hypothetical protein IPJ19_15600 [Planctomycetes bacterium]|nr:hypothetical protein [Planctomycetota bacterium]